MTSNTQGDTHHSNPIERRNMENQMHVASLELCKELYKLSGWENGRLYWIGVGWPPKWQVVDDHNPKGLPPDEPGNTYIPAYDLGYLLRKLPPYIATYGENGDDCLLQLRPDFQGDEWVTGYTTQNHYLYMAIAGTPEDAACKLAIELFKQGILKNTEDK